MESSEVYRRYPGDRFFLLLLSLANDRPNFIAVNDPTCGIQADYNTLLHDVSIVRRVLCEHLPSHMLDNGMLKHDTVHFCTLLLPNYGFIVTLLAILATGGVVVPLSTTAREDEALFLIDKSNVSCLLVAPEHVEFASIVKVRAQETTGRHIQTIQIPTFRQSTVLEDEKFTLDGNFSFSPERAAIILFSSGTTGPPKGLVHTRRVFSYPEELRPPVTDDDVFLVHRGVVTAGGSLSLTRHLLNGVHLEVFNKSSDAGCMWERIRLGNLTILVSSPGFWLRLMRFYETNLSHLPDDERQQYTKGAQNLRVAAYIGAVAAPSIKRFWWHIRNGKGLQSAYGSMELGCAVIRSSDDDPVELLSRPIIGKPVKGVSIKLSHGDHGEILVKSPLAFAGYLGKETSISSLFDEEGFMKTGDLAHMEGDNIVMDGRAETDFIKFFYEFRVPRLAVEARISELPYIAEAFVVPVPDRACGQRVGTIIRLRYNHQTPSEISCKKITLELIRQDLSVHLPLYQLPTILRTLQGEEDVPRTKTGKLSIKEATQKFFPLGLEISLDRCTANIEIYDIETLRDMKPEKTWDWAGIQRL